MGFAGKVQPLSRPGAASISRGRTWRAGKERSGFRVNPEFMDAVRVSPIVTALRAALGLSDFG